MNGKPKLYLETSIVSYYTARPSKNIVIYGNQVVTHDWWEKRMDEYEVYISQPVLDEAAQGDPAAAQQRLAELEQFSALGSSDDLEQMKSEMIQQGIMPAKAEQDAAHLAIAAINGMDFLLTWNCRHLANGHLLDGMRRYFEGWGLECPKIVTPLQLMEERK